jgi:hypothetical protein
MATKDHLMIIYTPNKKDKFKAVLGSFKDYGKHRDNDTVVWSQDLAHGGGYKNMFLWELFGRYLGGISNES